MEKLVNFEGKIVKPDKKGIWRCPYKCGDLRFPAPKWKTISGFMAHMKKCTMRPSAVEAREKEKEKRHEIEIIKAIEFEEKRKIEIDKSPHKIGDTIHYVGIEVVKPTHEWRFTRWVRVRYNEVRKYHARTGIIKSHDYTKYGLIYNGHIELQNIFSTLEEAKRVATERQAGYNEFVDESDLLR